MAHFHEWCDELADELARPFPPECHKTKRQGGSEITFVGVWDYVGRLNELVGPQGWTAGDLTSRDVGDKLMVAVPVTILGVTKVNVGTEDEDKDSFGDAATNAWAQAFKRSCALFGLGTYLYNPAAREAAKRGRAARPKAERVVKTAEDLKPATEDQLREIRELMQAGSVTDDVRERLVARLETGMTAQQAADSVAYLRRVTAKAEKPAGPPLASESAIREIDRLVNARDVPQDKLDRIQARMADIEIKPLTLEEAQQTIAALKRCKPLKVGA